MTRPRVSVIVPAYNAEKTIEECLSSLLALSFPAAERELIVVDNASSDRTPAILERYRDRARILFEPERGPAAARNRGLAEAAGEIVAFTDADCVVDPEWLGELVAPLREPGVGIAGGAILSRRPCNAIERFGERIHDHRQAIEEFAPPYAITMSWASPRSVLESAGGFDPDLLRCEDCDLAYRIVAAGHRAVFAPRALVYHRNERTLLGLAREGYAHGYHAVGLLRKHAGFVETYRAAQRAPNGGASDHRPSRRDAFYWRVFNFGKSMGRAAASRRDSRPPRAGTAVPCTAREGRLPGSIPGSPGAPERSRPPGATTPADFRSSS